MVLVLPQRLCLVTLESLYGGNHVCFHKVFWIWFTGRGGVHVIDWFLMILHQGKCIWMVWLVIIWLLSHASAMGSDLLCFCRTLSVLLRVGPVWSVLQIPSDSVARISQVLSAVALVQFGTGVAGVFSWLVRVIVIRWWIVESLKALCFYTRSLEIGQWSEHCFTPVCLSYKSWWSLCR